VRESYAHSVEKRLEIIAPAYEAGVAVAGRILLRVFPILDDGTSRGDAIYRELFAASWECLRLAAEASCVVKSKEDLVAEQRTLVARFDVLTQLYQTNKTSASWSAWSVGTAASLVKDCLRLDDLPHLAGEAASEALDALWQYADDGEDAALESCRLRAAIDHDLYSLLAPATKEGLDLGPLWPPALGTCPRWYLRYREWARRLTSRPDWLTVLGMLDKDAKRRLTDPALQEAFDAFDDAKLPRPPITKLTGLTPEEGLEALRIVVKYLDSVGDPVAKVVQLVLKDLAGKSFDSFAGTKEWGTLVQWILDRIGYTELCPKCSRPARLDTAPRPNTAAGSIRHRHTDATHGGAGTLPDSSLQRLHRPD
jgi:hypothetical protein